jgi:hypothetical protein
MTPLVPGILNSRGNINKKNYIGKLYYPITITITKKYMGYLRIVFSTSGVIDTAGVKFGDFKVEYLREFEAICEKALTRGSRAQVGLFNGKKPEVGNLVTLSL